MIISIAILLLARRVFSSLPVQGSISIFNRDTILINLHANKLSTDFNAKKLSADNLHEFDKLKQAFLEGQIHLMIDVGGKIIDIQRKMMEINDRINHKRNYFEINYSNDFNRMTPINVAEFVHILMENYPINTKKLMLKKMIDDINNILRHIMLIQENNIRNRMSTYQNLFHDEYSYHSKFIFEKEKWNLENEIFFEYAKSIQTSLLWLKKLFDVKRYELRDVFDNIIKWKLLNLQKQAQFLLENLIEKEKRSEKNKKYRDLLKHKNIDTVPNIENIKSRKAMILNKKDEENFNKIDKTKSSSKEIEAKFNEINNKTRIMNKNVTNKQIAPKVEMRILSYSELLKNTSRPKSKHKNFAIQTDRTNEKFTIKKSIGTAANSTTSNTYIQKKERKKTFHNDHRLTIEDDSIDEVSQSKKSTRTSKPTKLKNRIWINQLQNISAVSSSILKHNNQKQIGESGMLLHRSLKGNITDILKNPSRRTLQVLALQNKNETWKQNDQHYISQKNSVANYRGDSNMKLQTKTSAIDEILEAVDEILPVRKPAKISSAQLKIISEVS